MNKALLSIICLWLFFSFASLQAKKEEVETTHKTVFHFFSLSGTKNKSFFQTSLSKVILPTDIPSFFFQNGRGQFVFAGEEEQSPLILGYGNCTSNTVPKKKINMLRLFDEARPNHLSTTYDRQIPDNATINQSSIVISQISPLILDNVEFTTLESNTKYTMVIRISWLLSYVTSFTTTMSDGINTTKTNTSDKDIFNIEG